MTESLIRSWAARWAKKVKHRDGPRRLVFRLSIWQAVTPSFPADDRPRRHGEFRRELRRRAATLAASCASHVRNDRSP